MTTTICQISCLTADTGIPVFTRTTGGMKQLPFPIVGSLNGIDMFARNHGVEIVNTRAGKAKIIWKIFKDSLKFIATSRDSEACELQMNTFLDNVFNALVLIMGLSELEEIKNVDRFKKEVRRCFCVIDCLLQGRMSFGNVTQFVDTIICNETKLLQETLDAFVLSACDSEFGCLLVHRKVLVATEKWWQLLPIETMLLMYLIKSVPTSNARDFPVYLPNGSPNIPHRLLTMEIIEGVEVCIICGPEPSLQFVLENHLNRYWKPYIEILKTCLRSHPRNLPATTFIDNQINGFLLINTEDGKCLSSIYPRGSMSGSHIMTPEKRHKVLTDFYLSVIGSLFPSGESEIIEMVNTDFRFKHEITQTYLCAKDYKLYAAQFDCHQIFVLFSKDIPTYAMQSFTEKTFQVLTKDRLA